MPQLVKGGKWVFGEAKMLDGTSLLNIKLYAPHFDVKADMHTGWYETRCKA